VSRGWGINDKKGLESTVVLMLEFNVLLHIRLRLLSDIRFWMIIKFANAHSHDLLSPNKMHHFYSHQTYRSKMRRTIMTNLDNAGMHPSNIAHMVNAMNPG